MAIYGYFFNAVKTGDTYDRVYNSEDFCGYLDKIVGNGVFADPATNLQVRALSEDNMKVQVQAGQAWIQGHKMKADNTTLTLSASDLTNPRIDRIVAVCDYANRRMNLEVKKGTAKARPSPPGLTRNASRYELALADIHVNANATTIIPSNITDKRSNTTVCGYVTGLIGVIDTTDLFAQYQAAFDEWFADVQQSYKSKVLQKLEATYTTTGADEYQFNVTNYISGYNYSTDILMVYINGLYVTEAEYTRSNSTISLATHITHPGTKVTFVVLKNAIG